MKTEEKQLFKSLCNFKTERFDEELLKFATPTVLGHLFFNRMQAIAYGTLRDHALLGKVNREFRNSLRSAYEQNVEKNNSFYWCIQYLDEILSKCNCKCAMLKGAYLCHYYPKGYRTSSDIDLLVRPEDVTQIGNALSIAGFMQGNIRNGEFIPATRKEIIESKMLRGETVPYIKELNFPNMRYLEVDINFSLDYKNSATISEDSHRRAHPEAPAPRRCTTGPLSNEDPELHKRATIAEEATTPRTSGSPLPHTNATSQRESYPAPTHHNLRRLPPPRISGSPRPTPTQLLRENPTPHQHTTISEDSHRRAHPGAPAPAPMHHAPSLE